MGSGKSTIGPLLAQRIRYGFTDIDEVIEEKERLPIREIFKKQGEQYFRDVEIRTLRETVVRDEYMVFALGGGALSSKDNRDLVRENGILVYLKSDADEIVKRVRTRNTRPMLLSEDGHMLTDDELSVRVRSLLRERERDYLEAGIVVNTSNMSVSETVEEIVAKLRGKIV